MQTKHSHIWPCCNIRKALISPCGARRLKTDSLAPGKLNRPFCEGGRRPARSAVDRRGRRSLPHPRLLARERRRPMRASARQPGNGSPDRAEKAPESPRAPVIMIKIPSPSPLVAHDAVVHDLVPPDVPARIARDGEAVALLPVYRVVGGTRLRHGAGRLRR